MVYESNEISWQRHLNPCSKTPSVFHSTMLDLMMSKNREHLNIQSRFDIGFQFIAIKCFIEGFPLK